MSEPSFMRIHTIVGLYYYIILLLYFNKKLTSQGGARVSVRLSSKSISVIIWGP